ncbi:MAG: hypothetical protein HQM00_10710 [Magnetococcales bacterium]|nr:hypothetical protein [Magnetococcales bacterium]
MTDTTEPESLPMMQPVAPEILPILDADLEMVCQFLHERLNRKLSPALWKNAYSQPWMANAPNHGFMLVDEERVAGVFGAIYAERTIRGVTERFCNQNSWVVLESYRHLSLELWRALMAQTGYHVTMLTPNPVVAKIYLTRRFQTMGNGVTVIPNTPWPKALKARVVGERQEMLTLLSGESVRDCRLHRPFPWLHQVALGDARGVCHVVFKLGRWKRMPAAKLLHVSDGETFLRLHPALGRHLLWKHGVTTLHLSSRLLPQRPLGSFEIVDTQPRLFLSDRLSERDISWLYTEMVALDLAV